MAAPINRNLGLVMRNQRKQILIREAKKLESIAKNVWRDYLDSYSPVEYKRTGKSLQSIKLGSVELNGQMQYEIQVKWETGLAMHDSVVHPSQPKGHSIKLIDSGWHSKKLEARIGERYRFTYYEGFNYFEKVMKEYNKAKHPLVSTQLNK